MLVRSALLYLGPFQISSNLVLHADALASGSVVPPPSQPPGPLSHLPPQSIPIIGPIPGFAPLMVGDTIQLDPVTPGQGEAILCATMLPIMREILDGTPMVAVVDECTGILSTTADWAGRYATLAAIIDIRQPSLSYLDTSLSLSSKKTGRQNAPVSPFKQSVRSCTLLGIGRSIVTSLHSITFDKSVEVPVVIGKFEVLTDTKERDAMSPVHAVTQVHDLVVRIGRIHDRRCRIVAGLHVANARLERRRRLDEEGSMTTEEGGKKAENTMTPDRLVGDLMSMRDFLAIKEGGLTNTQQHKEHMDRLKSLNNWGVNHCLSSLKDLNMDMVRNMAPFYSVKFTSREMFYYEMFSFVVWKALKDYAVPVDVAQALQYRSCGDRLKIAYEKMLDHRLVLERIVEEKSQELVDCGEECVDLW